MTMTSKRVFAYISASILALSFLFTGNSALAGFGISPSGITLKNVLRGTKIEKIIVLSQNNAKRDILISVTPEGDIARWISLERGNKFTYPAGEKQFPVKVWISVPKDVANGVYKGQIRFVGGAAQSCKSGSCSGSNVGIAVGALASVDVTVTDKEVRSFRVLGLHVDKARANEKLVLALFLENNGNVAIQPDHIVVDIFDKFHKIQIGSFTVSDFEGKVPPQNSGPVKAVIPWVPEPDNYWAEVSVFGSQNQLIAKDNLAFEAEAGTGGAHAKTTGKGSNILYMIIGALGGGIIVLLVSFFFILRHLKAFKRQMTLPLSDSEHSKANIKAPNFIRHPDKVTKKRSFRKKV